MIIGLDGKTLTQEIPSGIKHYAEQLILNLANIDNQNQYIIFSKDKINVPQKTNFRFKQIPPIIPLFKRQYFLTYFAKKEKVDIFHFLDPFGSIFTNNLKAITTVHDLNLNRIYPATKSFQERINRYYYELSRKCTLRNSLGFIANSYYTKSQLRTYLNNIGIKRSIKVVYMASSNRFRKLKKIRKPLKPFLLCMGDYSPRKNIPSVMEAYFHLSDEIKKCYDLRIVISSKIPRAIFLKTAKELSILKSIKLIEAPKLKKLVKLYNQAVVFVYPSLYEGFGLPILESMACGCPVITSNRGATKEIAGKAAYLVNPVSPIEISHAITKIIKNSKLRAGLIDKGFERTTLFSWEETARKTLKVYEEVYKS